MTPREKLIVTAAASTLFAALALGGCQADTLIARVDGGSGGQSGGGTGGSVGTGGSNPAGCPAGPQAPLGAACATPDQRCAYGYNPLECGGRTVICKNGSFVEESHSDPQTSCFDGGTGADLPVAAQCCPRDQVMSGCMHLGGTRQNANSCAQTCDFWCSTNWQVVHDAQGCEVWTFDHRQPAPGENLQCIVATDGGTCPLTDSYTFGWSGGLVPYDDKSTVAPPDQYHHLRTYSPGADAGTKSCSITLAGCQAMNAFGLFDIGLALQKPDVQVALGQPTPLIYGVDQRPVDGAIYSVKRSDGHGMLVGGDCVAGAGDCRPITDGIATLVSILKKFDQQMLSRPECSGF